MITVYKTVESWEQEFTSKQYVSAMCITSTIRVLMGSIITRKLYLQISDLSKACFLGIYAATTVSVIRSRICSKGKILLFRIKFYDYVLWNRYMLQRKPKKRKCRFLHREMVLVKLISLEKLEKRWPQLLKLVADVI